MTPRLNLTGGLRYTYDHKSGSFNQTVSGGQGAPAAIGATDFFTTGFSNSDVSGQADASFQATKDVLIYLNYARGYKSGGLNLVQLPAGASPVVSPELIDGIEAGAKTRLFDRHLILNIAAFWEHDQNYQANVYNPAVAKQYLSNVPEVKSEGVEADLKAQPTDNLSFYASLTWDDAVYASYANAPCGLEHANLSHRNLNGRDLAGTPRWTFYSSFISSARRLPNGNTLIDEGMNGRIFQVTPTGEIVWEYVSPYVARAPVGGLGREVLSNWIYRAQPVPYSWAPDGLPHGESPVGRPDVARSPSEH